MAIQHLFRTATLAAALALLSPAPLHAKADPTAWGLALTDVPPDPAIHFGRLANGMRYAIRRNGTPKGTASIRLHFEFGSLAEGDDEQGLAHFIEHMAFNGTTNVAEGEMVRILQRQGLAFGPDTNASTGFDATIYSLDLPATDKARLDTALFLMREVASEVKFDPAAVDRERGVIEGERRARDNVQQRFATRFLAFQTPDAPYARRLPIGTTPVITTAPPERIKALYHRYYRPEYATLVIVGDVDPQAVEALIKAKFDDWRGVGPAGAPLPRGKVDLARPAAFGSYVAPAIPNTARVTIHRPFADPADTRVERGRAIVRAVATAMFNRRLERLTTAPGSVLLGGAMSTGEVEKVALTTSISLVARDGQWQSALSTAEQEVRRARTHGFTAAELKEVMANLATSFARQAEEADTRRNRALAGAILAMRASDEFNTTPAWRLAHFKAFAPRITLDAVNAEFAKLWTGSAPVVFVSAKQPVGPATGIAAAWARSQQVPTPAPADNAAATFAYDGNATPGKVVADSRIAAAGIRTIRFANNVRLNLKKTNFEAGRLRFQVRLAGGQLALPADKPGLGILMASTSSLGGTAKQSRDALRQVMAGRLVNLGTSIEEDAFTSSGTTSAADLATQLKVSAAYLLDPGFRSEAYDQWLNVVPLIDVQARSQPQGVAGSILPTVYANGDSRFGLPAKEVLLARKLAEAKAAYAPIAASGAIDIGIVGDFDEEAAIAAVAQSFGALPMRASAGLDPRTARPATFRTDRSPVTLTHSGPASQAMVISAWPTDDGRDPVRAARLALLSSAFQIKLIDKIREELGASYGASVRSSMSDVFPRFGFLDASAVVAPDKIDEVRRAIDAAAAQLVAAPLDADLLVRARNPILERADRSLRENGAWLGVVSRAQSDPARIERLLGLRARVAAITAAELQQAARQYLVPGQALEVRIVSSRAPLPVTAAR